MKNRGGRETAPVSFIQNFCLFSAGITGRVIRRRRNKNRNRTTSLSRDHSCHNPGMGYYNWDYNPDNNQDNNRDCSSAADLTGPALCLESDYGYHYPNTADNRSPAVPHHERA